MVYANRTQQSIKLQTKARTLRIIACCACLRLPLIKNMLLTFVEEVWARSIGPCELTSIHSTPNVQSWIGQSCSPHANIYSREWFYFNLYKRKSSARFFKELWLCKCKTCTLLRILLKSLLLKDNRRLMWTQMSIILRLGLQNMFLQFGTAIVTAMVKNFETLKPRCNRVKENFFRLTQALKALEALRQTKVEIVNLNQWLVKRLISSQTTSEVMLPAILNAGKRGLVKAIDRFDFDYPILFASYARMWVKHELLKKPSAVLRTSLTSPPAEVYTFGDISLKSLIELAKGVANFPPKVPSDDLQARRTNSREVHYGLSLLTSRERRMLMLRCCRPKWTLLAIGNDYKLSKERVRQLCNRSIKRLQSVQPPFPNIKPSDVNSIHFRIEINKSPHRFVSQNQQKTSPLPSYASSNGIQTSRLLKK